jgi:hypothetical protein
MNDGFFAAILSTECWKVAEAAHLRKQRHAGVKLQMIGIT